MSTGYVLTCGRCGEEYPFNEGRGFVFRMLHCDRCGKEKSVLFGDANYDEERGKYSRHCRCGGSFTLDAPPRCPKCGSTEHKGMDGNAMCLYD
jgi:Zn finger protein HypA/HybF involved in hydrogenase expression